MTLNVEKEKPFTQPLKPILSINETQPEMIVDILSTCSCPQCSSIDCFKIRYDNANLQCTCPSCKYASHKNVQSEKPSDDSYRELNKKVKDDGEKPSLNTNPISELPNKKSDDDFNGEPRKYVVKEAEDMDALDNNTKKDMAYKKSDEVINTKVLKENNLKDPLINNIKRDLLFQKFDDKSHLTTECKVENSLNIEMDKKVLKENEQTLTLNNNIKNDSISKKHGEKNYLEITKNVVKEHEQKDATKLENTKKIVKEYKQNDALSSNNNNNLTNKTSDEENHHLVARKIVKKREQKDSLNHEIVKIYIKEAEQRDTLYNGNTSDLINKMKSDIRKSDKEDEDNCKNCGKKHKHKVSLNTSYFLNKNEKMCCEKTKSDDKRHDQKATLNTCNKDDLPHKNHVEIRYRKITKKLVNEYVQTGTLDNHFKNKYSEVDLQKRTNVRYKDTTFIKDKVKKTERSYEESFTRNYSVAMTYTRKKEKTELENPTDTLSAQIMDLPYQDFKESISLHKSAGIVNSNKITKQDILAKLKEIYKACSCKVCECIPSFGGSYVTKDDTCGCDIKRTNTCNAPHDSQIPQRNCKQLPHSGCPCYRCDRKDCRGVWKNEMAVAINSCDCKPCDCVEFSQSLTTPCECEPCQCVECTPVNTHLSRPVIVAPVQGNFQQSRCQCEPCECANCTQNYGAMASSLMREVSTGMVSQRNCNCNSCVSNVCQFDGVDCKCDTQNRIVRKPIDRSGRDYDLRQAIVGENSFNRKPSGKFKNSDTIAMFTFADSAYANTVLKKSGDGRHGTDSECSFYKDEEKRGIRVKNSYTDEDSPLALSNSSDKSLNVTKCEYRCRCKDEEADSDIIKTTKALSDCSCTIYDCMACKRLPYRSQNNGFSDHSKSIRNEILFRAIKNCDDLCDNIATKSPCPLKKGNILTPAMFEAKIRSPTKLQMQSSSSVVKKLLPSNTVFQLSENNSIKKLLFAEKITIAHSNLVERNFNDDNNHSRYLNVSNIDDNNLPHLDTNKQNDIKNNSFLPTNKNSTTFENKAEGELFNCEILNVRFQSKLRKTSDADLFFSRIETLEKSLSQLQEDISLNRKTLAKIWSKDSESSPQLNFDTILTIQKKSHENHITDADKYLDINEETDKLQKSESETQVIVNKRGNSLDGINKSFIDSITFDRNDSFSKGDTKMYTKLVKRFQNSVKSKNNITRCKFKKLSKKIDNKIIDFIAEHLKENYRHHGNNKLIRKCIKSASTSCENCSVPKQLKCLNENTLPLMEIYESNANWSALRKNSYINDAPVTHNNSKKSDWNIPELEINTKRTVKSISLQTNETRGHAALAKLQTEVSELLNSPLLQLDYLKRYVTVSDMDEKNISNTNYDIITTKSELELKHCDASSQTSKLTLLVEKEINCNIGQSLDNMKIDMMKLLDFLLTRTVCKSELTKPFTTLPEMFTMPKVNYVKSSCEGLKASFLAVRKVSDHTVLVRWKVPREVENVQGYELQVDGRTVQKILSPTRCIAVLTCLPHCDKLLLTIQTITLSALPSGHRPAATIVYYPREKHKRYH